MITISSKLLSPIFLLLLLTNSPLMASAQRTTPACLTACYNDNSLSTDCDANGPQAEYDQCTCDLLSSNSAKGLLDCVKKCSRDDIEVYAGRIPRLCVNDLFPGVDPEYDMDDDNDDNDNDDDNDTDDDDDDDNNNNGNNGGSGGVLGFEASRMGMLVGGVVAVGAAALL